MMQIVWLENNAAKKKWLSQNGIQGRWVVSSVAEKESLISAQLKSLGCVAGHRIMRATELWSYFLKQSAPEIRVLQSSGAQTLAKAFLSRHQEIPWCQRPGAARRFVQEVRSLGPLVGHPEAGEILREYRAKFQVVDDDMFLQTASLALEFYYYCLELDSLPWFLVPLVLQQRHVDLHSDIPLVFSLGPTLSFSEKDLIQQLAQSTDVTVLIPAAGESAAKDMGLWPYLEIGLGLAQVKETKVSFSTSPQIEVWKPISVHLEVRQVVKELVKLKNSGVAQEDCVIVTDDPVVYETLLQQELRWEGLHLAKAKEYPLLTMRSVQKVMACLRVGEGSLTPERLQSAFDMNYRYLAVIKLAQNSFQLPAGFLRQKVEAIQREAPSVSTLVDYETFLIQIIEQCSDGDDWASVLSALRGEAPSLELPLKDWNDLLESILQKKTLKEAMPGDGIRLCSISDLESAQEPYVFILGMDAEKVNPTIASALTQEASLFFRDLGFDFNRFTGVRQDSFLPWLTSLQVRKLVFSHHGMKLDGSLLSPPAFWVQMEKAHGLTEPSGEKTTWELATENIHIPAVQKEVIKFKGLHSDDWSGLHENVKADGTKSVKVEWPLRPFPVPLSVSSLENYDQCPFRFFMNSVLRIRQKEETDLEPIPMVQGQWVHKLIELMGHEKRPLVEWRESEWEKLLDELGAIQKTVVPETWPLFKRRVVRNMKRFVAFETQWHPNMGTAKYVETKLEGFLAWPENGSGICLVKNKEEIPTDHSYALFSGKIDRIDVTEKSNAIVVDYKSSDGPCKVIGGWLKGADYQMPLYALAVESGFLERKLKVIGAQYYSLKSLDRSKGFALKDIDDPGLTPLPDKRATPSKMSWVTEEKFADTMGKIFAQLSQTLVKLGQGYLSPDPKKANDCIKCEWKNVCRAKHLM